MKRTLSRVANLIVLAMLLLPLSTNAQIFWLDLHPDLVPVDVNIGPDCTLLVTLRNNGPVAMPSSAYVGASTGIQMYVDGAPWGGIALGALDPGHLSQPVGGTVTWSWFPGLTLPAGAHTVTLVVDTNNDVVESNEANNTLSKVLTCVSPAPDLVPVSLTVNSQCQLVLTLQNIGTAPIDDINFAQSGTTSSAVQMYNDGQPFGGISLGAMDLQKQVQVVGGTVTYTWFPGLTVNGGPHNVSVVVDNNNAISELNESNNTLTQSMTCYRLIRLPGLIYPTGTK